MNNFIYVAFLLSSKVLSLLKISAVSLVNVNLCQHIMQLALHKGSWQMMVNGDCALKRLHRSRLEHNFDNCLPPSCSFPTFLNLTVSAKIFVTTYVMT